MRDDEFANFLKTTLCNAARELKEGGVAYVCIDWRHMSVLEAAGLTAFGEMKNVCVWVKPNAGMGTFYRSQHELVLIFKKGSAPHLNTFELGQHGRSRTNVWHYAGVTSFKRGRREELMMHPTVKPTALIADVILDCSKPGDVVLDPFVGSGTTIVAAEKVGRRAYVMELDPTYADVSIRRWQAYTGRDAVLESTGETFEELAERRSLSSGCQPKKGRSDD